MMGARRKLRFTSALVVAGFGLAACAESLAPRKTDILRLGVDEAYRETGLAEALRAGYEQQTKNRLELVYGESKTLTKALGNSEIEMLMTSESRWVDKLKIEGLLVGVQAVAHEELVFIGPQEDKFRSHGTNDPVEFLRNVIRSNHLYLRAKVGSVEAEGHGRLARANGDRPDAGSLIETKLSGKDFVKEVVRRRAFGLVRRSALVLAAAEGVKPHRVYQDGKAELVLPVQFHYLHPSKVVRPGQDAFKAFITNDLVRTLIARVGLSRVGLPLYGIGVPAPGEGARAPSIPKPQ